VKEVIYFLKSPNGVLQKIQPMELEQLDGGNLSNNDATRHTVIEEFFTRLSATGTSISFSQKFSTTGLMACFANLLYLT